MTPSGIEPPIFRFVAQHLNHCATAVPYDNDINIIILCKSLIYISRYLKHTACLLQQEDITIKIVRSRFKTPTMAEIHRKFSTEHSWNTRVSWSLYVWCTSWFYIRNSILEVDNMQDFFKWILWNPRRTWHLAVWGRLLGLLSQVQHPFGRWMPSVTSRSSSETETLSWSASWIKIFWYIFLHNPPLSHPRQGYPNQEMFLTNQKKRISQLKTVVSNMTPYRFVEFYRHFRVGDEGSSRIFWNVRVLAPNSMTSRTRSKQTE